MNSLLSVKILAISLLLLITGCSAEYEPLPMLNAKMCTVVTVWGGYVANNKTSEPDYIDIVYGAKVYRVSGPFPYKSFKKGEDIMVLIPSKD